MKDGAPTGEYEDFATGFVIYIILARLGLRPPVVELKTGKRP